MEGGRERKEQQAVRRKSAAGQRCSRRAERANRTVRFDLQHQESYYRADDTEVEENSHAR